jgi:hypothetical protein
MIPEPAASVDEPAKELGSAQQEARTCPVWGTKLLRKLNAETRTGFRSI